MPIAECDGSPVTQGGVEAVLALSHVGTWDWDVSLDRTRICQVTATMFGLSVCGVLERPALSQFVNAIHPSDRGSFRATIADVTRRGGLFVAEYRTIPAHGELRWVMGRGFFETDRQGVVTRGRGVCIDMTASKRDGFGEGRALFASVGDTVSQLDRLVGAVLEAWDAMKELDGEEQALFEAPLRALLWRLGRYAATLIPQEEAQANAPRRLLHS